MNNCINYLALTAIRYHLSCHCSDVWPGISWLEMTLAVNSTDVGMGKVAPEVKGSRRRQSYIPERPHGKGLFPVPVTYLLKTKAKGHRHNVRRTAVETGWHCQCIQPGG